MHPEVTNEQGSASNLGLLPALACLSVTPASAPFKPWLVVVPLPVPAVQFMPPHGWKLSGNGAEVPVGCRVLLPWRGELLVGLVVGEADGHGAHRLREVVQVLDRTAWVPPGTVEGVTCWARDARIPAGLIWSDLLGVGWNVEYTHRVRATAGADLTLFAKKVPGEHWTDAASFAAPLLDSIREQGLLDEEFTPKPRLKMVLKARELSGVPPAARTATVIRAVDDYAGKLTPKQAHAAAWLAEYGPADSLSAWAKGAGVSNAVVTNLLNAGGAEYGFIEPAPPTAWTWLRENGPLDSVAAWATGADISPTAAGTLLSRGWADSVQVPAPAPRLPEAVALAEVSGPADDLPEAPQWRLHGGRAAERFNILAPRILRLLEQGRGVLVLAPEHATLRRAWEGLSGLAQVAGTQAVQVSGTLNDLQREETWKLIRGGQARLVVGSSLALCAPLPDLALLVVLEEGSDAYKLLSGSRAFVPDIAARVAQAQDAALAYVGTAPAAESVLLPGVVLRPPRSRVHVVDYANPPQQPELGPLSSVHLPPGDLGYPVSHDLARLLRQVQERGRQAALLAPRRGYSALLRCPNCEYTPHCKNCDVPLRFHQQTRQMTCHQCGYHEPLPDRCDNCGERMWRAKGPGTEWITQEVGRLLPGSPVYRLDKDQQDDLTPLKEGKSGVVVGTQLLLSQPCPPNLALLGITLADTWLNVSDFRASERYHRLLRQLAEWHPSRAPLLVVQTFQADHPALKVLLDGRDALVYPLAEERARKELGYPPHARLAQIEITAREAARASAVAHELAAALHGAGASETEVLGPAPSPVARLRGVYPYHLLLRTRNDKRLGELLKMLDSRTWKARVRVDVNPRGRL